MTFRSTTRVSHGPSACKPTRLLDLLFSVKFSNDASLNWILFDGNGHKRSTNGTWLYVDDFFRVYDKMVFKACNCLFQANLIDPEDDAEEIMMLFPKTAAAVAQAEGGGENS